MFFGPYKLSKLVRGQSATWVPNEYYWRGKPQLDKIICQVVSLNSASQAIKSQKFDVAAVVNSQWKQGYYICREDSSIIFLPRIQSW